MFTITAEWLNEFAGLSITNVQLVILGEQPRSCRGWRQRAIGRQLSEADRLRFEQARGRRILRAANLSLFPEPR